MRVHEIRAQAPPAARQAGRGRGVDAESPTGDAHLSEAPLIPDSCRAGRNRPSGRLTLMRFVVLGAGGIGGVIGARLFEHGYEVALIARGAHLDMIRKEGMRLESPDSSVTLEIPAVSDAGDIEFRGDDVVLLAVKSQDTAAAISALAAAAPADIPIVCVQNGVENERVALRSFPNVNGICVVLPTTHLIPGVVQAHST